eukprot:TRINITY_DN1696_c0_g1_i1.p1 TRINITY_DN1696_c0_g1~~TRINITY_DN1696_c0_g1_i1.p1  ORF type:complete len:120 (-),score=30.67 TRINITY_DN1696_c0_g1_i1:64-423(-)
MSNGRSWGVAKEQYNNMDNRQVLDDRQRVIRDQDDSLDLLLNSAKKQKEIARDIGTETKEQLGLLDDIEARVDNSTARIKNTTRRVEQVRIKSSTKCMWGIICMLILALIVVVILAIQF